MKRFAAGLFAVLLASPAWADGLRAQVDHYRAAHEAALVGQLVELTRFKSVAADPAGRTAAAARLVSLLAARGFKTT
ncbi:MAG TPA: hypothetical protein VGC16_05530, partial [Rhizomicrobium sp.]